MYYVTGRCGIKSEDLTPLLRNWSFRIKSEDLTPLLRNWSFRIKTVLNDQCGSVRKVLSVRNRRPRFAMPSFSEYIYPRYFMTYTLMRLEILRGVQKEMFEPTQPLTMSWKGIL